MARPKGDGRGQMGGGRKKGTQNKVTREMRAMVADFLEGNWDAFKTAFDNIVEPDKKCNIYLQLLPYATPKLQSMELKQPEKPKTFKDELDEDTGEKTRG